jgi:hypothetical protein
VKVFFQQPQLFPWAGYWHKVWSSDVNVIYGGVQYAAREYQNRVKFLDKWLSLPVHRDQSDRICDCQINPKDVQKMGRHLRQNLLSKDKPHRARLRTLVEVMEEWRGDGFLAFQVFAYDFLASALGIRTATIVDPIKWEGTKYEKLGQLLRNYGLENCTLMEGSCCRHFEFEQVPEVMEVQYQSLQPGINPESILWRLATDDDPLEYVKSVGKWEPR